MEGRILETWIFYVFLKPLYQFFCLFETVSSHSSKEKENRGLTDKGYKTKGKPTTMITSSAWIFVYKDEFNDDRCLYKMVFRPNGFKNVT